MKLKNKNILCQNVTVLLKEMTIVYKGFPGVSDGKESACNVGDLGSISMLERSPGRKDRILTTVFWPGEVHGQRSLADYSPWGCKESDIIKWLTHTHKPIYSILEPSGQAHAEPSINRRSIVLWEVTILSKSKPEWEAHLSQCQWAEVVDDTGNVNKISLVWLIEKSR